MADQVIEYDATQSPVLDSFHGSDSFMRAIMGPVGSGKSVACTMETFLRANAQEPLKDSIYRPTKWAIVRNTYRELEDTTIATFFQWIPRELGHWRSSKHTFEAEWPHPSGDGTIVQFEVIFRALDTPKDAGKLLSLEVTGGWFNEAREIPFGLIDLFQTRVGRFPPKKQCVVPAWNGIFLDTNPPDSDTQFYKVFEELKPNGYELFRQPSGLSHEAENKANLIDGYYERLCLGKTQDFIDVYVKAEYGFVIDGKPIFPEYVDQQHCRDIKYTPSLSSPIVVGIDFGLTPAAVFGQVTEAGKWVIFDEIVTEDMGAKRFGGELRRLINKKYAHHDLEIYGDPAGDNRSETDESTAFMILRSEGIHALRAPTNDQSIRFEAIRACLTRMDMGAEPGFLVLPCCKMLRKSLKGGYCYKRMQVSGADRYQDKPDKSSRFSHVNDALQYLLIGAGEGKRVIKQKRASNLDLSRKHIHRGII